MRAFQANMGYSYSVSGYNARGQIGHRDMPPLKPTGSLLAEDHLAQRIELERRKRKMSYEGLAQRVTEAGCPIQPSAIHKIEKGNPRRRITVDEAIAYAEVFGIPIEELLVPPLLASKAEFLTTWADMSAMGKDLSQLQQQNRETENEILAKLEAARNRLGELVQEDPSLRDQVADLVAGDTLIHPTKRDGVANAQLDLLDHYAVPANRGETS